MGKELKEIKELKRVDFGELDSRLRSVRLKGFPNIKPYESADISIREASPEFIGSEVCTPQPTVYAPILERINRMRELFLEEGIDISRLNSGIDYIAVDEKGEETAWTLIPPVVEVLPINFNHGGKGLDYSHSFRDDLWDVIAKQGHQLNPELEALDFPEFRDLSGNHLIKLICDGSHRIHHALELGNQNLLFIENTTMGVPYYAAPKPYSVVHMVPERDDSKSEKTHVLTSPGHKLLYRLFPSGGILSGDVRTPTT